MSFEREKEPMKIIKLTSQNVKRLRAVTIEPDGALVQITGKNGAGKSSVIDSISMAFGGASAACERPVREGEEKANIVCELDEDLIVRRTFTADGRTSLSVTSKDGLKYPSPQAVLDKLVGRLTFDPLEFSRMEPRKQVETLRNLVGLDFSKLDRERLTVYDERTDLNRTLKQMEGQLAGLAKHEGVPEQEVSIAGISAERRAAMKVVEENRMAREGARQDRLVVQNLQAAVGDQIQTIERLEKQLNEARATLDDLKRRAVHAQATAIERESAVAQLSDPDLDAFDRQIEQAEATNRKVRDNARRASLATEVSDMRAQATKLTEQLEAIDRQKSEALAAAKFPVPGLSFNEGGVLFNNIPFSQASSGEQLRVSVAMGLALNPKLKVLLIRDGSLLDADGLRMVAEMAEGADSQVWIERVDESGGSGVVIEDGMVKVAEAQGAEATAEKANAA